MPGRTRQVAQNFSPLTGSHTTGSHLETIRATIARQTGGRLLVSVHVTPRASGDALSLAGDTLRIRLHAPPVEGAANAALLSFFAARLRIPKNSIQLERGANARVKVIAIADLSVEEFWRRLGFQ
jgi:uncharacterized protein (TIGR00251 family)